MMQTLLSALLALACLPLLVDGGEPNEWLGKQVPQLVLANGRTYAGVTFKGIEPDAVTIAHADGVARIPMEELKPEAREALGYDPAAAARKRAAETAAARRDAEARRLADIPVRLYKVRGVLPDGPLVSVHYRGGLIAPEQRAINSLFGGGSGYAPAYTEKEIFLLRGAKGRQFVDDQVIAAQASATGETFQYASTLGRLVTVAVLRFEAWAEAPE